MSGLTRLWERLGQVEALAFQSQSTTGIGWAGKGTGVVYVSAPSSDILVWRESGEWQQAGGVKLRFSNVFRWTQNGQLLRLEHLRFGESRPVFLFDLESQSPVLWREVSPHPCSVNCYRASLQIESARLLLKWRVEGPTRDENIETAYF